MSLLQQNSSEVDDAAKGEELTRGTSHIVWATIVAAVLVTVAIVGYAVVTREGPAASGQVTRTTLHIMHHETKGLDAAGAPMPKEEFDQLLVFSHVQIHNRSKVPLFLRQVMTNVTLAKEIRSSYAAVPRDYERLFQAYPELAALHSSPLSTEATIPAGQTVEGDFVSSFKMTHAEWDVRKGLNYTVSFQYQPDIVLLGPASVEVQ